MSYGLANTKDGELGIDSGIYQHQYENDTPGVRIYAQVYDAAAYLAKAQELGELCSEKPWKFPELGS